MFSNTMAPRRGPRLSFAICSSCICTAASAQLQLSWWTVDAGGGISSGGGLIVQGTVGQSDAGTLSSPGLSAACGYWSGGGPAPCYANGDLSTSPPILNANDFQCFLNQFAQLTSYANCDQSTAPPILNTNDFQCFLNKFAQGCP